MIATWEVEDKRNGLVLEQKNVTPLNAQLATAVAHKLLLGFAGAEPPPHIWRWLAERPAGGFTLFRYRNIENPCQVRQLTGALQQAARAAGQPPLLICADQEGGQLNALGPAMTPFPGNMALGAAGDAGLAYRAGLAIGRECAALGINVNYAPSCDVNSNPQNPVIGVRSFGEEAERVAELAAAVVKGIQDAGVASAIKHFPGHGDTSADSHHGLPVVAHDAARLWEVELRPFAAAIEAGAKMVMTAHVALPALHDGRMLPATLSPAILQQLLRRRLNFQGVIVSDALDMGAISQGAGQAGDMVQAMQAGVDLLLMTDDPAAQEMAYGALVGEAKQGDAHCPSVQRILALKQWIAAQAQPDLHVVGCAEHRQLAQEIANRAVTLVRDDGRLLPLRLAADARIALITPQFQNLTPADTSASETMTLGQAVRRYHARVDEYILPQRPDESTIATFRERASQYDLVIVGTIEASRQQEQATLVKALLAAAVPGGAPVITVALRTPYDLAAYPQAQTHVCTYSIQEPALHALAAALWGEIPFRGKLPVRIPGLPGDG